MTRSEPPDVVDAGRLTLRRPRPDDGAALYEAVVASADHLRPWMPWAGGYTPEMAEAFVAGRLGDPEADANYLVWDGDAALVGGSGLHRRLGPAAIEVGYWVHVAHTRRGYASLAAAALTGVAFSLAGVDAVEIHHDEANTASRAVAQRLGFVHVATRRDEPLAPGEVGVEWQWRMARQAWPASAGARLLA